MSSIDSRIVQLKFDNSGFESAVRTTLGSLDKLKHGLNFSQSKQNLADLDRAAGSMKLGNIGTVIEGINSKFLALATVGVTALSNISSAAINAGAQLAKSVTIDPIMTGLKEYETNLNSIQTILANTQASGAGLKDVTAALDELNEYSDKTIYNFSEMARNIGTFTAAGVDLETATGSIKGIANLAAMSGSNSMQASTAMYQLSQAISAGRVSLMDWNSVVNAGMGGTVFQRALAQTAVAVGTLDKGSVKLTGTMKNVSIAGKSFRESLSADGGGKQWLTTEVLTKTLEQFTGDLSDAELAAQGFTQAQIKAIQAQAKTAMEAATQVKTLSQVLDVAKETATSGWAQTWRVIFGDFNEAKSSFTELSNFVNGFINDQSEARLALLNGWSDLGGREVMIEGFVNAFKALESVLKPIKEAFREVFPAKTAQDLFNLTKGFRDFFAGLKIGDETAELLKRSFAGVFALLSIGKQIITGVFSVFGKLFKTIGEGSGGFLGLTAKIGDFLVKLDNAMKQSGIIQGFFDNLGDILAVPVKLLNAIGDALNNVFSDKGAAAEATGAAFGRLNDRLNPLKNLFETLGNAWDSFLGALQNSNTIVGKVVAKIAEAFGQIGPAISESVQNGNYEAVLDTINTALLGGMALLIKRFVTNGFKLDIGGGMLDRVSEALDALTGSLKAMEQQIKAKTLLMIAGAVALLAASVVALSLIDSKKLSIALGGLAAIFTELFVAMAVLGKMSGTGLKLTVMAAGLILLSTAIFIMTGAVAGLSAIPFDNLKNGLFALGAMLAIIVPAAIGLSKVSGGLITAGAGLIMLATALTLLAGVVKIFSTMDWGEMAKGLAGVAGGLAAVAAGMRLMPKGMVAQGAALILIATALNILAMAVKSFADMDWDQMGKGLAGIAGSLLIIAGAMRLMPKGMVAQAAALILIGVALNIIGKAVAQMGGLSMEEIAKGLGTLAASLVILAAGVRLMSGALTGAAALLIIAAALRIFVPVLQTLGGMSVGDIVKGLVALAAAFAVIGVAAYLLTPVIPQMLALGATVALLGVGLALAGAGVLAFATAITMLIAVASMGTAALTAVLATIIGVIPSIMKVLELALVAFAGAIIAAAPAMVAAVVVVLTSLLKAIEIVIPKFLKTLGVLLDALLGFLINYIPKLVEAGYRIITGILNGIAKRVPDMIKSGTAVIIAWIKGIGKAAADIAKAAGETLLTFLEEMTKWINANQQRINTTTEAFVRAIINGLKSAVTGLGSGFINAITDLAGSALDAAKSILGIASPSKEFEKIGKYINQGLIKGVVGGKDDVIKSFGYISDSLKAAVQKTQADLKKAQADLNKVRKDDDSSKAEIRKAEAAYKRAKKLAKDAKDANEEFNKDLKTQKQRLIALGDAYDKTTEKLKTAQQTLDEAKRQRDDFAKNITDSYTKLPDITEETSLDTYFDDIRKTTEANNKFKATLDQLRDLGLDDISYRKFLNMGVETQPFLDDLLASGATTIAELNKIDANLATSASALGSTAASELYQAGVDAAQGIVNGLIAEKSKIEAEMVAIGKAMAAAIKKELGIKSPSRVFAKVGKQSNEGLALGLKKYSGYVKTAAKAVGNEAVSSMRDAISNVVGVGKDVDVSPVVAPVLDLDEFRKKAAMMKDIMAQQAISPTLSSAAASDISRISAAIDATKAEQAAVVGGTNIEYNQYNNSPKALSSAEIYRQTKNQLAIVKGALPV